MKKRRVLLAAYDVGPSRALAPLYPAFHKSGFEVVVVNRGTLPEATARFAPTLLDSPSNPDVETCRDYLEYHQINVVIFGTNMRDIIPLRLARAAALIGRPTVHVLDAWTAYTSRLAMDGLPLFLPQVYVVPDQVAARDAICDGIPERIIEVTGHPGLTDLMGEWHAEPVEKRRRRLKERHGFIENEPLIIFVNEPASTDQGLADDAKSRGYDEFQVQNFVATALSQINIPCQIGFLPHPKEDPEQAWSAWQKNTSNVGKLLVGLSGREAVFMSNAVIGMASILLYEAWLVGIPVCSVQPQLRFPALRALARRRGIVFIDRSDHAVRKLKSWLAMITAQGFSNSKQESEIHRHAPKRVVSLAQKLIENR